MKRNQLMAGLILVPLLLSGCGSKLAANEAAPADAKAAAGAAAQSQGQNGQQAAGGEKSRTDRPQLNENEMRLRMFSQSLLAVDKAEGLAFSKQQAEQLLPLAEAAVTKKELTAEQQESMLKVLTPEQTKLYQSRADQMKQRSNPADGGTPPKAMTQEERDKLKEQRPAQGGGQGPAAGTGGAGTTGNGGAGADASAGTNTGGNTGGNTGANGRGSGNSTGQVGQGADAGSAGGAGGPRGRNGGPGAAMGADSGQQLVDLLKERAK